MLPRRGTGEAGNMVCPHCHSGNCFRSRSGGVLDLIARLGGLKPWRCHACGRRFYARRVALSFVRYAHCPKCGNFDLQPISRERVEKGTLLALKRWLGFPAYRCEPCRQRFFSALPHRRILPSPFGS